MSRYLTTPALVINKKSLKETDYLVTLLTPQTGKVVALAKGVRSIKSSRLGNLQLGNIIKVHLYSKDDRFWISETDNIQSFLQTGKTITQLNLLFYFLEILNALIAENQQIDSIFTTSLQIVEAIDHNSFKKYIDGEIKFISVLGFGTPDNIQLAYSQKDYKTTQANIKQFLESIIEKRLESNKLFK